ncbi:MAG: glycine C-acetyltransferase [Candidatus Marinimicrobia bacterium]|jgi:glycine C-acetyltransferase|nr:glycine C-acetyltransferase [Candidatus Neomarinimicrobiota bacterium]MDG1268767.1 glycine C-acetyltransferase [Candidatus Neomarinimicrobiota bacterium]
MANIKNILGNQLEQIKQDGTYKHERIIQTPQETEIDVLGETVINFCANNYLGLSNDIAIKKAAIQAIDEWGFGLSSVRFICGTQTIHKDLENKVSEFHGKEDTILYSSCFDANGGLFETILSKEDAVFSDELNHASIIDGIRLSKAEKNRYRHADMEHLEELLKNSNARLKLIATDGVFSMDGVVAPLKNIVMLAKKYDAMVMVDDCHATGFLGNEGKGSGDYHDVLNDIDIITSTFGKALGGASGGFVSASKEIVETLRQKSRPYLFSNSLAPPLVAACIKVFDIIENDHSHKERLDKNTMYFRQKIKEHGFDIKGIDHPIVPIMIYDEKKAVKMSEELLKKNIYVIAFSYPVVATGQARIRVQISSDHSREQLDYALQAFHDVGTELNII